MLRVRKVVKVLLIMNNTPSHPSSTATENENVRVVFLPLNITYFSLLCDHLKKKEFLWYRKLNITVNLQV